MLPSNRKRRRIKHYMAILALSLLGLGASNSAFALVGCQISGAPIRSNVNVPNPLVVPATAQVGDVLFSQTFNVPLTRGGTCLNGQSTTAYVTFSMKGPDSITSIAPNISPSAWWIDRVGSGLAVRWTENGTVLTSLTFGGALLGRSWDVYGTSGSTSITYGPATVTMEIIVADPHPSSPLTSMATGEVTWGAVFYTSLGGGGVPNGGGTIVNYKQNPVNIVWSSPTCSVATTNITIPLGNVDASVLQAVGDTSPTSPPQDINLSCSGTPPVTMSIAGVAVPGETDAFGLAPAADNAGGVAVQLLYNNATVVQSQSIPVSGAAPTSLAVPISARYIRTGAITPGTANANMTATFNYN